MDAQQLDYHTKDLTDPDFERLVAQARQIRSVRALEVSRSRQMHTATLGVSTQYAWRESPEGVRSRLLSSLMASGMTRAQAEAHIRSLGG